MPELPEVQTTVDGLQAHATGFTITSVWTDLAVKNPINQFKDTLKSSAFFEHFKKAVVGRKVIRVERRGKNILIHLDNKHIVLVHMKMTGHMMVGSYEYQKTKNTWIVSPTEKNEALHDPYNRFIHVVWTLQKGKTEKQLVLCDSRKFAKVTLLASTDDHKKHLGAIGPEPLNKAFTEKDFTQRLKKKMSGAIKTVLMNPEVVAGIGNIYSDELLWLAGIHPERKVRDTTAKEFKAMYEAMKAVLLKGIDFGGDSTSDYRNIMGEKGQFHGKHNVYRETKKPCKKKGCPGVIQRKMIGGRSAHFCPVHQQ